MKKSKLINQLISQPNTPINTPTQNQFTNCESEQIDKQAVEEMAKIIALSDPRQECKGVHCVDCELNSIAKGCYTTKALYNAGYRKRSVGEWIKPTMYSEHICSNCGRSPKIFYGLLSPFCPNCGAKMKGGAEG